MAFPSDLEIARAAELEPIEVIAAQIGIGPHLLESYGTDVAKVKLKAIDELNDRPQAKYVVVSAVTPTPLGEGKTTTTVGLGQAFRHIGKTGIVAIRQPSMGPTFGIKGGAAGGGHSQVVPMERLNLHLTGDMHAVTAANNLLAAMIDNHVHHHDDFFSIDRHSVTWRRVMDVNDRVLRNIIVGLGLREDGVIRQTGFDITAASEVMAILALSTSVQDMRARLGRIVIGNRTTGEPVTAEDLHAAGAMAVIMEDAIKPNLLQTIENTPVFVHAGPFGNIAHGNSSIVADKIAIRCGDFLITEAGFGADMGAERFFNIKCRASGLVPDAAVLVATVRTLKAHSGRYDIRAGKPLPAELLEENPVDVEAGADNLRKQIDNIRVHGVTPVVAVNTFPTDHSSEKKVVLEIAEELSVRSAVSSHFTDGGKGAAELAEAVAEAAAEPKRFSFLYPNEMGLRNKIKTVATKIYGAADVEYDLVASRQIDAYERQGFGHLPVHRKDASVDLVGSASEGRSHRVDSSGPPGPCLGRRRLHLSDLRRHAHDAGSLGQPGRRANRHRRQRRGRRPVVSKERAVTEPSEWGPNLSLDEDRVYVEQPLGDFLEMLASSRPTPGGGAAAAMAVALAAGLVAMVARFSMDRLGDSFEVADRADTLRVRVAALAQEDTAAYQRALDAYRTSKDDPATRRASIAEALSGAANVPLAVARAGVEVARLAARVAAEGNRNLRGDAAMAALLGDAGVRGAVTLVRLNLDLAGIEDERVPESDRLLEQVEIARQATVALVTPATDSNHGACARVIDGRSCAWDLGVRLRGETARLTRTGLRPGLATIIFRDDHAAAAYERRLRSLATEMGFYYACDALPRDVEEAEAVASVGKFDADPRISGILVLRPLPPQVSEAAMYRALDPVKDIEAVHPANAGLLALGRPRYVPSTPASCFHLLDRYLAESGRNPMEFYARSNVVIVGRSANVGKPAFLLGLVRNATIVSCDEHTFRAGRLYEHTGAADILIVAAGVAGLIGGDHVRSGVIAVDVGINPVKSPITGEVRFVGDLDYETVAQKAEAITPVPGGVGPVTQMWLLRNTLAAVRIAAGVDGELDGRVSAGWLDRARPRERKPA